MYCIACGKQIDSDAVYCNHCGFKQTDDLSTFTPPLEPEAQQENDIFAAEKLNEQKPETQQENDIFAAENIAEPEPETEKAEEDIFGSFLASQGYAADGIPESDEEPLFNEKELILQPEDIPEEDDVKTDNEPEQSPEEDVILIDHTHDIPLPEPELIEDKSVLDKKNELPDDDQDTEIIPRPADFFQQPTDERYDTRQAFGPPQPSPAPKPAYTPETAEFVPQPVEPPAPENVIQPEPVKKQVSAGRLIGAGIISFFAALFLILLSLMFSIKLGISGDIVSNRISQLKLSTVLDSDFGGKTVSDALYDDTAFGSLKQLSPTKSAFRSFMEKSDFLDFVGERAERYVDYILNDKGTDPSLSSDDIVNFYADNRAKLSETFGYDITTAELNAYRDAVKSNDKLADKLSIKTWNSYLGFNAVNLYYVFSYITLGILLALVIVLFIWAAVAAESGKHIVGFYSSILLWCGFIVFLTGAAVFVGAAVANVMTGKFIFYVCAGVLMPFSLFAMVTGAFELFLGYIFRKVKKAIRASEKRRKAVQKALSNSEGRAQR